LRDQPHGWNPRLEPTIAAVVFLDGGPALGDETIADAAPRSLHPNLPQVFVGGLLP
jgi:hypothetical protein